MVLDSRLELPLSIQAPERQLAGFSAYDGGSQLPSFRRARPLIVAWCDPTPVVHRAVPFHSHGDSRLPRIITESPPTTPVSASNIRRGSPISGLHRSRYATARGFASPSWLAATRWNHVRSTTPSEVLCHSRFWPRPSPTDAGSQARWANGKSPIIGTCTRPVTAASEAAQ